MLNKDRVLSWNEVECDLYTENDLVFGVELDLFNGHKTYYVKYVKHGKDDKGNDWTTESYEFFGSDVYWAIDMFNDRLKRLKVD